MTPNDEQAPGFKKQIKPMFRDGAWPQPQVELFQRWVEGGKPR